VSGIEAERHNHYEREPPLSDEVSSVSSLAPLDLEGSTRLGLLQK